MNFLSNGKFGHYLNLMRNSDGMRIFLSIALAYGIRRNVGTEGPSISLNPRTFLQSLTPRNVLWLLVVFETQMMFSSGGQQMESFISSFFAGHAKAFLAPNGLFWLSQTQFAFALLTVVAWIVFVYGDESAVRVTLAGRGLGHGSLCVVYV